MKNKVTAYIYFMCTLLALVNLAILLLRKADVSSWVFAVIISVAIIGYINYKAYAQQTPELTRRQNYVSRVGHLSVNAQQNIDLYGGCGLLVILCVSFVLFI
ncbi:MAG: hypothetical protein LBM62_09215 [Mediterranea sp.]|jgi:hypothetical protein|nr:hypothetical protein [Mediterranea sp.]